MEFYDHVYGKPPEKERAIVGRKFEMGFFKDMNVHSKVKRSAAKQIWPTIITTRWVDTSKGDEKNLDYRVRLVGREMQTNQSLDLFAAPPLLNR